MYYILQERIKGNRVDAPYRPYSQGIFRPGIQFFRGLYYHGYHALCLDIFVEDETSCKVAWVIKNTWGSLKFHWYKIPTAGYRTPKHCLQRESDHTDHDATYWPWRHILAMTSQTGYDVTYWPWRHYWSWRHILAMTSHTSSINIQRGLHVDSNLCLIWNWL